MVEVLELTLNSEEEVREASWRANQAGMVLEGGRMYPLTGIGENLTSTWNHIEPGRARGADMGWAGVELMLGHWVFFGNKEELLKKFMNLLAKCFRDGSGEPMGKPCQ